MGFCPKCGNKTLKRVSVTVDSEAQQRLSKKALLASNPTQDEFVPGNSPFYTKDVTSRSAMLGLQGQGKGNAAVPGLYWDQKNPNAVKKNTGNRRKKKA